MAEHSSGVEPNHPDDLVCRACGQEHVATVTAQILAKRLEITDEMVERALVAFQDCPGNGETWAESAPRAMRAALEAAL